MWRVRCPLLLSVLLLACSGPASQSQKRAAATPVAPTLTAAPANGATKVPVTLASVVLTASEPLDPTTITEGNISLSDESGAGVATTPMLSSDGLRVTLPLQGLRENDTYSLYVAGIKAATSAGGLPLAMPFQSQFTTATAPPMIVQTTPQNGAAGVPVGEQLAITFSQPVHDAAPSAIELLQGTTPVVANVTFDPSSTVAFVVPTAPLLEGTTYSVTVGSGLTNISDGLPLPNAPVTAMTFTTELIAPTVVSVSPMNLASGLTNPITCSLTFSAPMATATVNSTNILLTDQAQSSSGATPIGVALDETGTIATITPAAPLTPGDTYALVATTGVTDIHGIALLQQFSSEFSLALLPVVISITPADGSSDVGLLQEIQVRFNEPVMNVGTATFTVTPQGSSMPVPGIVTVDGSGASFSPSPPGYAATTVYTVALTAGITDTAGAALTPFSATFTTGTM